jgi:DNA-binding transcriptional ArsR family regulator
MRQCKTTSAALTFIEFLIAWPGWWAHGMPDHSDTLFWILGDSTRRRILDLLAERGPLTVGQLAAEFPDLVASGISKHLMSLRAAGLVSATRRGREQIYQLEADVLAAGLAPWVAKYERYWSSALERLRDLAERREPRQISASDHLRRRKRKSNWSGASGPGVLLVRRSGLTRLALQPPTRPQQPLAGSLRNRGNRIWSGNSTFQWVAEMTKSTMVAFYIIALIGVIVGVDVLFFRNRFWERLLVNIGIVLVFAAFYLRFLRA